MNLKIVKALIAMIQSEDDELVAIATKRLPMLEVAFQDGTIANGRERLRKRRAFWNESMREEAAKLHAKGWSWRRIGKRLNLSGSTVQRHVEDRGKREP